MSDTETRAIELYLSDNLPHDRPWSQLSPTTQEGYRQQARTQEERAHPHAS